MANGSSTQSAVSPNGYFDAINICTNSRQLQVGSSYFPTRPINDLQQAGVGYTYTIQSLGGGLAKSYGTTVTRNMYNSVGGIASIPTGSDTTLVIPAVSSNYPSRAAYLGDDAGAVQVLRYPSGAYYGYDLERCNGILFSGFNTRASPPFINLNLGAVTNASITCNAWGLSDVILSVDVNSKSVQAFI